MLAQKLESKKDMICLNPTSDSSDSSISYSSAMSLSSSPVRSSAIQDLLQSPIIKASSLKTSSQSSSKEEEEVESDSDPEVNDDEIMVSETPETSPVSSQETNPLVTTDMPLEVLSSQSTEDETNGTNCESNSQTNGRNSLRRQTSVCVSNINTNITSSPRALAILKNAIKTSFNSNNNKISDKTTNCLNNCNGSEELIPDSNAINGTNSPPNRKLFINSPLSRGSALLKAAKERLEKQELERSPKILCSSVSVDSSLDRKLTGILRKHEMVSSGPICDEPKAKKKRVLFAEPVVSSELEFKSVLTPTLFKPIFDPLDLFQLEINKEIEQLTQKRNNTLVHQNSTFDKEFDANSIDNSVDSIDSQHSDSPLLITDESEEIESIVLSCGQHQNPIDINPIDDQYDSQTLLLVFNHLFQYWVICSPI